MGIYIKGISKEEFLSMYHSTRHGTYIGFNPEAITEIEEPHGRLIDENEVRVVMNYVCAQPQRPTWNDVYNGIRNMYAVIEAEGE